MIQTSAVKVQPFSSTVNGTAVSPRMRRTRSAKQRLTITLTAGLLDRLRNAVYWTPYLTLAGLIESAVNTKLDELEKQNGEPFQVRHEELKGGRPRRSRQGS